MVSRRGIDARRVSDGVGTGAHGHLRPFPESSDNFSGPESYFMSIKFTLKIQILLACKAKK